MFGVRHCNASCFTIFLNIQLNNCFWKIWMVLRRTYKFYSSGFWLVAVEALAV